LGPTPKTPIPNPQSPIPIILFYNNVFIRKFNILNKIIRIT